jgi:hypothetical protein
MESYMIEQLLSSSPSSLLATSFGGASAFGFGFGFVIILVTGFSGTFWTTWHVSGLICLSSVYKSSISLVRKLLASLRVFNSCCLIRFVVTTVNTIFASLAQLNFVQKHLDSFCRLTDGSSGMCRNIRA